MRRTASAAAVLAHRRLMTSAARSQRRAAAEIVRASELKARCAVSNTARSVGIASVARTSAVLSHRRLLFSSTRPGIDPVEKDSASWVSILTGFLVRKVGPGQIGVTHLFGKVSDTTLSPGLHFVNPLRRVVRFSTRTQERMFFTQVHTREGFMVELRSTLLFRIDPSKAIGIYTTLSEAYFARIVVPTYEAAIRDVCSAYEAKALYDQASYHKMEAEVKERLTGQLEPRGIIIEDIPLTAVELPAALTKAIQRKEVSEDARRLRKPLEDCILREKPSLTWQDVAGLEGAKRAIEEAVILPRQFPQMFTGKRKPWKGVLLYGPPGTGKTLLAKAAASLADATFFSVSSSSLVSKWFGDAEKLIRELFSMAEEQKPSVIFIDEIDSIAGRRTDDDNGMRRMKTELLVQMSKVHDGDGVVVLGATNRPWDLDPAVRRRFEKRICIPLPDTVTREALLNIHLGGAIHADEFDLSTGDLKSYCQVLAGPKTEGYSGSDFATFAREVLLRPVRTAMCATHFCEVKSPSSGRLQWTPCRPDDAGAVSKSLFDLEADQLRLPKITEDDFEAALLTTRPTVSQEDLRQQDEFTRQFGTPGGKPARAQAFRSPQAIKSKYQANDGANRHPVEDTAEESRLLQLVSALSDRVLSEQKRASGRDEREINL